MKLTPEQRNKAMISLLEDMDDSNQKLERKRGELEKAKAELEAFSTGLEEKVKNRTFELSVLYEVSNAISYTLDYQQLLKLIMESLFKIVDYDICASLLFDVCAVNIILKPANAESFKFIEELKKTLIDCTSMLACNNFHSRSVNAFVLPLDSNVKPEEGRCFDQLRSFFNVPFIVNAKVVGMINISSCRENAFSEEKIKLVYAIAAQTANAIERLRSVVDAEKTKMESMVESMAEGIIMIDERGDIVVLNPQARSMLAFEEQAEITTRKLLDKLQIMRQGIDIVERLASLKNHPVVKEISVQQEENRILHCEITSVSKGEKFLGICIYLRDITREKEVEGMKTEFITTVSHELRTPLSITREGISLVQDEIPGRINEKQKEILATAMENIDRLARIINNLLDISKIEAGKAELKRSLNNITSLVKKIVSSFASMAEKRGLELRMSLPEERIDVYADADRIVQVLTNLINNALKFTKEGIIEVSIRKKEKEVECSVADTGIGISKDDIPKVFSKFQQFSRVEGAGEKGTGLGLSIAKGIVEMHQGKIWVESKFGKGSRFFFTLPRETNGEG